MNTAGTAPVAETRLIFTTPAYNEVRDLPRLVARIKEVMDKEGRRFGIVVCDDGSRDGTAEYLAEASRTLYMEVVMHPVNLGYGPAMTDALTRAAEVAADDDIVITMDADATQDPVEAPAMVAKLAEGFDVVIASRYVDGAEQRGFSLLRRILSLGAGTLMTIAFPTPGVRDYSCGYRAIRGAFLKRVVAAYGAALVESPGFAAAPEILLKFRAAGARFAEVPFTLRYDEKEGASKIRIWRTIRQYFVLVWRLKTRPPRPRMGAVDRSEGHEG